MTKDGFNSTISRFMDDFTPKDVDEKKKWNKAKFALAGELVSIQAGELKKCKAQAGSKASGGDTAGELEKWLESPMSREEREKHFQAAFDLALSKGADVKELVEMKGKLGIGQSEDQEIHVVDFSEAVKIWEGLR